MPSSKSASSAAAALRLSSCGHELDSRPESFGRLQSSGGLLGDADALRKSFAENGYLYIPAFFPREDVQAVRMNWLKQLSAAGWLDSAHPLDQAIFSGRPPGPIPRAKLLEDRAALEKVIFSPRLTAFYAELLGGEVRHYDHVWTRVVGPGAGTNPHCDLVYMGRGTHDVMTAWIPFGDVSLDLGGLMILEKSHLQQERLRNYLSTDVDAYCVNRESHSHKPGWLSNNPATLREKLGGRWLSTEFRMGDLLTFGMKTVHASLDNQTNQYRFSTDTRYQLASKPIDARWVGEDTEEWAERNRVGKIC